MNSHYDESKATLTKALVLIDKTILSLTRLDHAQFPTDASGTARERLISALEALRNPTNTSAMNAAVLYSKVLRLQELVAAVEESSTDHVSWPLVGYCDEIWNRLFPRGGPQIFYSVTPQYNYRVFNFSEHLKGLLSDVLPAAKIKEIASSPDLYCLQLASVEDDNLPLYANIGHEFGHAVYHARKQELDGLLNTHIRKLFERILKYLYAQNQIEAKRLLQRTFRVVESIAKELFCDVVGGVLMGPAFFLSLYEMAWGQQARNAFTIDLSYSDVETVAYPSFPFRLEAVFEAANVEGLCDEAKKDFNLLGDKDLRDATRCFYIGQQGVGTDAVNVWPPLNQDAAVIKDIVRNHLRDMKDCLRSYLRDCQEGLCEWYPDNVASVPTADLAALLLRLEHKILPNVVPNDTLLGRPASFCAVLNASALYRLSLLANPGVDPDVLLRRAETVERLTAKALEVSFVQKAYLGWRDSS